MGLLGWAEKKTQAFSIWDYGVLKLCLFVIGMIVGAHVSMFVKEYIIAFVMVFAASYAWLLYRVLTK